MQTRQLTMCLVALIATLTPSVQVGAQAINSEVVPQVRAEDVINVDFSGGGTLEDLLRDIEGSNDVFINVVASDEARQMIIPELELRNVRVVDLMKALNSLGLLAYAQHGQNLFSVTPLHLPRHMKHDPGGVQIYDIRALVTEQFNPTFFVGVDDIVTAMTIAWDMTDEEGRAPSLKFHEETYLLVVYGNSAQQKIAKTVLERLTESQQTLAWEQERDGKIQAAEGLQQQVTALTMTVSQQELINRELEEELVRKIKSADEMHARAEKLRVLLRDLDYSNSQLKKELEAMKKEHSN